MNLFGRATAAAALIAGASLLAMPASALPTDADCKAEFSRADGDRDQMLKGPEMKAYTQVQTKVDTNKDGFISSDEYIVACKQDLFNRNMKQGG